jgi:hypothetical protein
MKIRVQLMVCDDDGHEETFTDVAVLEKACQRIEHLGLTLPEAKQILAALQQRLVEQQTAAFVATRSQCEHCGKSLGIKGYHTRTFRTLFGTVPLTSPRLYHCRCQRRKTTTFRPLNALLTDAVAPELLFMETKWASLMSYGLTAQALKDFLPVDATLNATTIQQHALAVAQRCEDELGEEQWAFVEGCPADWATLPIPDGPLTVGIDGGYVRDWHEKKNHFEVIVGKSILAFRRVEEEMPSSKCFGLVQTLDTKPKRRLFEVLHSQGHQMNQQLTFLSDGGDTVRDLQLYLSPYAEHLLDWFHLAMRLTVLQQTAKGLPLTIQDEEETYTLRDPVVRSLERLKWSLWHGNVYKAFQKITDLAMDLDVAVVATGDGTARKLLKAVEEFHTYIERNRAFIPNYGERYRYGERISTGFVESTVNQVISRRFCKKQQMQWTKRGAHLLLQMRVKTLNQELGTVFRRWYPDLQLEEEPLAA